MGQVRTRPGSAVSYLAALPERRVHMRQANFGRRWRVWRWKQDSADAVALRVHIHSWQEQTTDAAA